MATPTDNPFLPPGSKLETDGLSVNGEMKISYRLTALDHLWFNLCNIQTRLVPQLVMVLASVYLANSIAPAGFGWLVFIVVYLFNSLLQMIMLTLMILLARNRRLLTDHQTALTDAGLLVSSRYVRSLYFWNGIDRVRTFPWLIAVFVNANSAQIIPKRAFSGDAQLARFLAIIAERRSDT